MTRDELIRDIFKTELGRDTVDAPGMAFWQTQGDLDDWALRNAIRLEALGKDAGPSTAYLQGDQRYASFYRGSQFDESQIQSSLQSAQDRIRQSISASKAGYDQSRLRGAESINNSFETRQNRTGGRLSQLAQRRADIDRSQVDFESGLNEQSAGLERQAATNISKIRRQDTEERIAARDRLSARSAGI